MNQWFFFLVFFLSVDIPVRRQPMLYYEDADSLCNTMGMYEHSLRSSFYKHVDAGVRPSNIDTGSA